MKYLKFNISFIKLFVATVFVGLLMSPLFIFAQTPTSKLAVTPKGYDDMGQVLEKLGYGATEITIKNLEDQSVLSKYDAIYINCSNSVSYADDTAVTAIKSYVQNGGTIYASDWASTVIDKAFPGKINFYGSSDKKSYSASQVGNEGEQTAKVVDSGLQAILGKKEVKVNFDMGSWAVIDSVGGGTKVYIKGPASILDYNNVDGGGKSTLKDKPYVVSFTEGKGQVLYTSFHNEAQNTEDMEKILNWFGIKTKGSKLGQATNALLEKNGNKVLQEVIDGINQDESKSYSFKATGEADFSITLNFGGSAIDITITGPDGQKVISKNVGSPPYTYEVKGAKEGDYKVSVKGAEILEKNYPFVLAFSGPESAMAAASDDTSEPKTQPVVKEDNDNIILYAAIAGGVTIVLIFSIIFFIIHRKRKKKKAAGEKAPVETTPEESANTEATDKTEEKKDTSK